MEKINPFLQRIVVSVILVCGLVLAIVLSARFPYSLIFPLFLIFITGNAVAEFYHISRAKGFRPKNIIGQLMNGLYIATLFLVVGTRFASLLPLAFLFCSLPVIFVGYIIIDDDPLSNLPMTLFALLYLTLPLGCVMLINYFFAERHTLDGRIWLFYLLLITYITDSAALFWGKSVGSMQLAPYISPRKTWEGALGGFVTAVATSLVFRIWFSAYMSVIESLFLGASISVLAQLGDLAESILKRSANVKDSAHVPGLGGFLDIVDSLIFTAPFLYLYLRVLG